MASRSEPFDGPLASGLPHVAQPVVQAVLTTFPELNPARAHRVATPIRWQRRLRRVLFRQLEHGPLERVTRLDDAALARRQRGKLRPTRPRREVRLRHLPAQPPHRAGYAYLMASDGPVEDQRRALVRREVAAFAASVVRIEKECAVLDALEQHHAGRRPLLTAGRERHRVGLRRARVLRLSIPAAKEREGIARRFRLDKRHLARAFFWHVLAKLLERGTLEPRDVHLADAEPARDLRLRHLLVKPHRHDRALARGQMLHCAVEHVAHLDALQLRIGAADLLGHRAVVLPVAGRDRLVERDRHLGRAHLHRLRDVVGRDANAIRKLAYRWLATQLVLHLLVDADHRLVQLLQTAREPDRGSFVAEVPLDLACDSQRGEGRELVPEVGVKTLDGLDQAEVADLDDVVERFTAVLKFACQEVDEVVVGVDEPRTDAITLGRVLAFLVVAMERPQLLARNPRRRTQYLLSVRRSGISLPGA